MTTIAANRRSMAADSKVTDGDTFYYTNKLHIIGESIIGVAGICAATNKFLEWFRAGCPRDGPTLEEDDSVGFSALVLNRSGLYVYSGCFEPDKLDDRYYAIGTGKQHAVGMMRLGHTPANAVRAAKVDPCTGGRIREIHLKNVKRLKA